MASKEDATDHDAGPTRGLRLGSLDYASAVAMLAYASSATVTPISLVILARELNFSLTGGGVLETVRSFLLLFPLLASGFISAKWGKPLSLGVSCLVLGGGMLLYSIAPVYGAILLGVALLGLGGGVIEGLIAPLVQDLHPRESGRYLNLINSCWSIGVLMTMLLAGELLTQEVSWRWVAAFLGGLSLFAGTLFLAFSKRLPSARRFGMAEVWRHKRELAARPRFWAFMAMMFLAGAVEGAYMFWSASYIQLHYGSLPRAGGIGAGLFAAGMVIGRIASGIWVRQHALYRLILGAAMTGTGISFLLPLIDLLSLTFLGLFFAGLAIASFWPSLQSYAGDRLPVEPTSLFVLLSLGGIPGFAFAAWSIGRIGDATGLREAFFLVPTFFLALTLLLLLEAKLPLQQGRDRSADLDRGS